jgi:hypothetical protein
VLGLRANKINDSLVELPNPIKNSNQAHSSAFKEAAGIAKSETEIDGDARSD